MIDGSELPSIDENIAFTRKLGEIVHGEGAVVEAELGRLAGEEVNHTYLGTHVCIGLSP
jgi:fructose/tagatose bisphosphate aldolase